MTHFDYKRGVLHAEDLPLDRLAAEVGTPFYLYSAAALEGAYTDFEAALAAEELDFQICYAVKANPHQAIISTFARLGAGLRGPAAPLAAARRRLPGSRGARARTRCRRRRAAAAGAGSGTPPQSPPPQQ